MKAYIIGNAMELKANEDSATNHFAAKMLKACGENYLKNAKNEVTIYYNQKDAIEAAKKMQSNFEKDLLELYGKHRANVIPKFQHYPIFGVDVTNIEKNEKETTSKVDAKNVKLIENAPAIIAHTWLKVDQRTVESEVKPFSFLSFKSNTQKKRTEPEPISYPVLDSTTTLDLNEKNESEITKSPNKKYKLDN